MSQVYGSVHTFLQENEQAAKDLGIQWCYFKVFLIITYRLTIEFLIYDDGCHLKKYASNPTRKQKTPTAKLIAAVPTVIDRLHFKNHVDPWCYQNCNPNSFEALKKVGLYLVCLPLVFN
jgi:hypothetical protein